MTTIKAHQHEHASTMEMPLPQTLRRALEAAGSHKGKVAAAGNDSASKTLINIQTANAEFAKKAAEGPREKGRKVLDKGPVRRQG